jgi:F0F1-type ATP synthase membrane subunit b/b'
VHGIYRASTPEIRQRRRNFIDELKRHVPVHAVTDATGELMGKVSGEQAAKGITPILMAQAPIRYTYDR